MEVLKSHWKFSFAKIMVQAWQYKISTIFIGPLNEFADVTQTSGRICDISLLKNNTFFCPG